MARQPSTSIISHGEIESQATETYGNGKTLIRIGNGGAGATGLFKALAEDYLTTRAGEGSIDWVCNHSRNTQLALLYDYIDLGFTYERSQEALAETEGWSRDIGCIFHDHFCLVGPPSDPAGIMNLDSIEEAFAQIESTKSLFHSRADFSATMWKERSIWMARGYQPWDDDAATWYRTNLFSPQEALIEADKAGAYLLTDRSTLLRQTSLRTISNTTVFFEPTSGDHILMNSCHAIVRSTEPGKSSREIDLFMRYVLSPRGQGVIQRYGIHGPGMPLFAPVMEGFAKKGLKGGKPVQGVWVTRSTAPKL